MTELPISHVHVIPNTDPTEGRLRNFGTRLTATKELVATLERELRHLDDEAAALTDAGVTMTYSLGPVGDAAKAARRTLEQHDTSHADRTFELPRPA